MAEVSRRDALLGFGGAVVGVAVGGAAVGVATTVAGAPPSPTTEPAPDATGRGLPVAPIGAHQAGIARPATPQRGTLVRVVDLGSPGTDGLRAVGDAILRLTDPDASPLPDGPGDLTVTIGLGPRISAAAAVLGGGLPAFAGDDGISPDAVGGDLLISACASDPGVLEPAVAAVLDAIGAWTPRWQQRGFRSPGEGTVARNPLGFHDGIVVPHGDAELDESVWIADGELAGGTVCVVRRLRLNIDTFRARSVSEREAVIGRRLDDGAPLSGGVQADEVDLRAKTPEGEYLVPARSHARAAHPSFTGSGLMLRRGYGFDNGAVDGVADAGLLFVCFQSDVRTFVRTQQRLDEVDDLMTYAVPTASASFVVPPPSWLFD